VTAWEAAAEPLIRCSFLGNSGVSREPVGKH